MNRRMRCPFCNQVFPVTDKQMAFNYTFRCPKCKAHNQGSTHADKDGILIGEKTQGY